MKPRNDSDDTQYRVHPSKECSLLYWALEYEGGEYYSPSTVPLRPVDERSSSEALAVPLIIFGFFNRTRNAVT